METSQDTQRNYCMTVHPQPAPTHKDNQNKKKDQKPLNLADPKSISIFQNSMLTKNSVIDPEVLFMKGPCDFFNFLSSSF